MSTKLIAFGALFAREILRVDSPVSNIIYVPHVRPPRLPWRKCRDIFVGQHMTRHKKKKATVRPLPKTPALIRLTQKTFNFGPTTRAGLSVRTVGNWTIASCCLPSESVHPLPFSRPANVAEALTRSLALTTCR